MESAETGAKFFEEDEWDRFEQRVTTLLRNGIGSMKIGEVKELLSEDPLMIQNTESSIAYGWHYAPSKSRSRDYLVATTARSIKREYLLVVVFSDKGTLEHFKIQQAVISSRSSTFTTRPIMQEAIVLINMQILSNMIENALDRSGGRAVDRANEKFNETLDRRGGELAEKAKDALGEADVGGAMPTSGGVALPSPATP